MPAELEPITVSHGCDEAPEIRADLRIYKPLETEPYQGKAYYRVRFEIEDSAGMPTEIFVLRKRGTGFGQFTDEPKFSYVAKVFDLVQIPAGGEYNSQMHTRAAVADIMFPSLALAEQGILEIRGAIEVLIADLSASYCIEDGGGYTISN